MLKKDMTIYIQSSTQLNTMSLTTLDILLDESLVYGTIYVPKTCFSIVSKQNQRLPAKQTYDLLLRLADYFPVHGSTYAPANLVDYEIFEFQPTESEKDSLITDCYLVSRHKKLLLNNQLFDAAVESILFGAENAGCKDDILSLLPDMLAEKECFLAYDLGSAPFLIYTGDTTCYNILSVFAKELGDALHRAGHLVTYFDLSKQDPSEVVSLVGKRFQAIIGIQSYMFSIRLENNVDFLHDLIVGPKYNFVFDHPIRFESHLRETPKDLTILTPDRNYAAFANQYYPVNAKFLPPGGIVDADTVLSANDDSRIFDVTFVASFDNFTLERLRKIHTLPREERFLINHVWLLIRKDPRLTIEKALSQYLEDNEKLDVVQNNTVFFSLYHKLRAHLFCISDYYRYQVLKTLLDAGIKVDVFGTSWCQSPLKEHPCFIWHNTDLTTEECLKIWQQSKIALNVMSWHKDAITERILNSMLQKAVVVTERNPYICEEFVENEDLVLYDLIKLSTLPEKIHTLLTNAKLRNAIADGGHNKALQKHTWDNRVHQFLKLLDVR